MSNVRKKNLTEGGHLREKFNMVGGSIRPSTQSYNRGLAQFLLQKELSEYVSRFKWHGLPEGLSANILETMLYYKGQVALFQVAGHYYVLPFVYTGQINQYGIQQELLPISYSGQLDSKDDDKKPFASAKKVVMYDKDFTGIDVTDMAIIIKSQSSLFLNAVVPPVVITDELRQKLAENLILIRNNLILSQKIKYISVETETKANSMRAQVDNMLSDILNGEIIQIIQGQFTFNEVNSETNNLDAQKMWQSFASLDNLRMEFLGILNNGVFEKRERNLTDEVAGKQTVSKLLLQDAWDRRKEFCDLAKKYFNLDIRVELSEMNTPLKEDGIADKRAGQFNPEGDKNANV